MFRRGYWQCRNRKGQLSEGKTNVIQRAWRRFFHGDTFKNLGHWDQVEPMRNFGKSYRDPREFVADNRNPTYTEDSTEETQTKTEQE